MKANDRSKPFWQRLLRPDNDRLDALQYVSWEDIEADKFDPRLGNKYETVCIWCGVTCVSVEALEEHEDECGG